MKIWLSWWIIKCFKQVENLNLNFRHSSLRACGFRYYLFCAFFLCIPLFFKRHGTVVVIFVDKWQHCVLRRIFCIIFWVIFFFLVFFFTPTRLILLNKNLYGAENNFCFCFRQYFHSNLCIIAHNIYTYKYMYVYTLYACFSISCIFIEFIFINVAL